MIYSISTRKLTQRIFKQKKENIKIVWLVIENGNYIYLLAAMLHLLTDSITGLLLV